jgi:hypothetical protein
MLLLVVVLSLSFAAQGDEIQFNRTVPIESRGTSAFYIAGHIEGFGTAKLLVDTGSGYTTIDVDTLAVLKRTGRARYLRSLKGIMADGSQKILPVYRIASINLGGDCVIRDVEAAVFPARTRPILGLNVLSKVSPFIFSVNPPSLMLSCKAAAVRIPPGAKRIRRVRGQFWRAAVIARS